MPAGKHKGASTGQWQSPILSAKLRRAKEGHDARHEQLSAAQPAIVSRHTHTQKGEERQRGEKKREGERDREREGARVGGPEAYVLSETPSPDAALQKI